MAENKEISMADLFRIMRPKNVCVCKGVSEAKLVETIHAGAHTMEELVFRTGASTKCGSCAPEVRAILEREMKVILESNKINTST